MHNYKKKSVSASIVLQMFEWFQILELAHNKKSEHLLNLQSNLDDESPSANNNHYDYCVKLEDKLQYDNNKRDEELEMCMEEIEKNLSKLRY